MSDSTQEERVNRSWEFLPKITELVMGLAQEVQNKIKQFGSKLLNAGMTYVHVVGVAPKDTRTVVQGVAVQEGKGQSK